ncbi:putative PMR5 domain, PC-Esterase [Rosa chinensis]|uniref:Putative PMR5 domain, PC-Esterase n=1 Tax=Rosa chinensis TaxID=74649 RepID=A0A2P6QSC0_ROSCH|nr:protein trichome birefringence-like 5 [Rosa chinensis]PRQ37069.1 putative PMR5 domain, PC-Esterase [Rosa chinensis]
MAVATPSNSSPQKSRYAFIAILFITLFLFTIFVFTKRALEPSLFLYKDYFTQIPSSSSSSSSPSPSPSSSSSSTNNSHISLSQSTSAPTADPPSSLLQSTSAQPTQEPSSRSEFSDENVQDPDLENQNVQDPDRENENVEDPDLKESNDQNGGENENPDGKMGEIPCDLYVGSWVRDEQYPLYKPGSCPYVDEAFDCQSNGRRDSEYLKWRWKPDGCDLPRFNATDFLVRLRGKRLMLVGDSMNRNQFESILCLLREGLHNKSRMYEVHGHKISKGRGYFVFKFQDYDCTVEFVRSHFLVKEGVRFNAQGNSNPTLSMDQIDKTAKRWKKADILVFNTGHWWTHGKTARGKNYYKEGDYLYPKFDASEAYRRALKTWASWVELNVNPKKQLIFYRGYSSSHFRGGDWDSGGSCNGEKEPAFTGAILDSYPLKMKIVDEVIKEMKVPVKVLNVTRLTNFRKDGHPSIYGKKGSTRKQDCSHWCVPGVPDAWNELIYATLVFQQTKSKSTVS